MKKVQTIHRGREMHWVGDGFAVQSLFSYQNYSELLSPFLLLDYAEPREFSPTDKRRGVGKHPHRGFETVTIAYEGEISHKDSTGAGGTIGPGDVQWMTAGSGVIHEEYHSENFAKTGGSMEMVQLWVNLPKKDKMTKPGYQGIVRADIPSVELDNNSKLSVIAGIYDGVEGPAKVHSPINMWDLMLSTGDYEFKIPEGHNCLILSRSGSVQINDSELLRQGQVAVFHREGQTVKIEANDDVKLLLLTGEPIDDPVVGYGPFVMNSEEEIKQAFEDFNNGTFIR